VEGMGSQPVYTTSAKYRLTMLNLFESRKDAIDKEVVTATKASSIGFFWDQAFGSNLAAQKQQDS
jgi:hypothetical protein